MKDANEVSGHMDVCQGRALFEVISNYDTNTRKGRNELYKLLFDKKNGALGGGIRGHEKIRNSSQKKTKFSKMVLNKSLKSMPTNSFYLSVPP